MIQRKLGAILKKSKKSILLLGPRQVGKSTLLGTLGPELKINLAKESTFAEFSSNPNELESRINSIKPKVVFIDEIQRLPSLLNTVQTIIDDGGNNSPLFLLSGSSARKLKRGKANLLPGRLHSYELGTVTAGELDYHVNTVELMEFGALPGIITENSRTEKIKTLRSYSAIYLKEEVQAEALSRNIEGFSRFLKAVTPFSGNVLDLSKLSQKARIQRPAADRYIEILEDTLIAKRCFSYQCKGFKKTTKHPKIYFFDTGVMNGLLGSFKASDDRKGFLFENLIYNQLLSAAKSQDKEIDIKYFRTHDGTEVDFVVQYEDQQYFIEVKATDNVGTSDLKSLLALKSAPGHKDAICFIFTIDGHSKKANGIEILPWQFGLKKMGL